LKRIVPTEEPPQSHNLLRNLRSDSNLKESSCPLEELSPLSVRDETNEKRAEDLKDYVTPKTNNSNEKALEISPVTKRVAIFHSLSSDRLRKIRNQSRLSHQSL